MYKNNMVSIFTKDSKMFQGYFFPRSDDDVSISIVIKNEKGVYNMLSVPWINVSYIYFHVEVPEETVTKLAAIMPQVYRDAIEDSIPL